MRTIFVVAFATLLPFALLAQSRESIITARQDVIFKKLWAKSDFDSALLVAKLALDTVLLIDSSEQHCAAFWKGRIGVAFLAKQQSGFAIEYLTQAKAYFSQRENARTSDTIAIFCQNLGIAYSYQRKFGEAKSEMVEAAEILKNNETPRGKLVMGQVYSALTNVLSENGEHDTLIQMTKEAIAFLKTNFGEGAALIGNIHQNMGKSYFYQGMYPEAEAEFKYAFEQYNLNEINRQGSKSEMANILSNIGGMRFEMGDFEEAVNYCTRAIAFLDSMGFSPDAPEYLNAYGNIAHAFREMGEPKKAKHYFLEIIKQLRAKSDAMADVFATAYDGLGQTYLALGMPDSALAIHSIGLPLIRDRFGYRWQTAFMEFNIGKDFLQLKQLDSARTYLNAAIETHRRGGGGKPVIISEVYRILGGISLSQSRWDEALLLLDAASQTLSDASDSVQADFESRYWAAIFEAKAQIYFQKYKSRDQQPDDLDKAYINLRLANQWLDRSRSNVSAYNPEILQNILAYTHLAEAILWEMYQAEPTQALADEMFETADRGKSRALFEQFRFFNTLERRRLPADSLKKLNMEMSIWTGRITALTDTTFAQKDARVKYQSKIAVLKNRRDSLLKKDPNFAKRHREPPSITRAQAQSLLDPDQCLLEYTLTDSMIYVFLLRKDRMLPPLAIKKDARLITWHDTLLKICRAPILEPAGEGIVQRTVAQYAEAAHGLYCLLLDTLRPHLTKRVTVVRDGELHHIPFEALIEKRKGAFFDELPYLLHKFAFSYENTAALYYEVRQRKIRPTDLRALVLAPFSDWGYGMWGQLPKTAESIPNLCTLAKGCDIRLGANATKTVLTTKGSNYRFIHLSAHAKADDLTGQKSFVLFRKPNSGAHDTMPPDTLFAAEIFGLDFQAELISLNACETSRGQLNKGEGVICMAWAFTGVGARSLVTTLWEAEADKAAPFVFNEFYGLLGKGMSRDLALSKAKENFLKKRTGIYDPHPFYWAPFILTGETESVK